MKRIIKTAGKILLFIIAAFLVLTLGLFIFDRVQRSREEKMLAEKGYMNLVSAGDYRLNVCYYGSDTPKHTIVGLSGKGVHNFSVVARGVTDRFADENRIVFIDRAGYGLSDDTAVPQTTEQIVSDYRTALKNAGFEPPYIIMPHSIGGVYTTYWESTYPDEVEAVIFLDCSQLDGSRETFDFNITFLDTFEAIMCKAGWQRPLFRFFDTGSFYEAPDELSDINKALIYHNSYSLAMISEAKLANENCYFAYENMTKNDIPKLYIKNHLHSEEEFVEMVDMMNELQHKFGGKEFTLPDNVDMFIENLDEFYNGTVLPYAEALGNCEVFPLNGTHMLYYHRPKETADAIEAFLAKLDDPER